MKNWQKDRNYRKYENADGSVTYVITIDSEDIEVSEDVFSAYSQADRRERYLAERDTGRKLSLDRFAEKGITLDFLVDEHVDSAEDCVAQAIADDQRAIYLDRAVAAFMALDTEERDLIQALVINGVPERDYADDIGLSQKGVNKRKHKILGKLKKAVLKP